MKTAMLAACAAIALAAVPAAAQQKTIKIGFSKGQLKKLRAALLAGTKIKASITGAIVDSGGNIERSTAAKKLLITA